MEHLGIPDSGFACQDLLDNQNMLEEFIKTRNFLKQTFINNIETANFVKENSTITFINYGDMEQIYVLDNGVKKYTVVVSQPSLAKGKIKQEFDNLKYFSKNNEEVVKPLYYCANEKRELYITPYYYQARCIASQDIGYGLYIPEPDYHFLPFDEDMKKQVTTCMIALLIKTFDSEKNCGLGNCHIGGGDFILEKEWSTSNKTLADTIKYMKIIAARDIVSMPMYKYINKIKEEFVKRTYYENRKGIDLSILLNQKSRIPLSLDDINKGIQLGLKLKNKR